MFPHKLPFKIFIYTALPCEAKPLIDFYRLKKDISIKPFAVYSNSNICLAVTGIGKTAMAAAIGVTQALFSPPEPPIMLNIGIAGHKDQPVGELLLIDKITDVDTDRHYYPPLVINSPCATWSLQTSSKPQLSYPPTDLCDMEGSAFYETSARFSTGELIQCLKIVSDNESSPMHTIQPTLVIDLISAKLPFINTILQALMQLSNLINLPTLPQYEQLLKQFHFTATEQIQLKKLLSRWQLLKGEESLEVMIASAKNSKELLYFLDENLNESEFYL